VYDREKVFAVEYFVNKSNLRELDYKKKDFIIGRDQEINDIIKHFDIVLDGGFASCIIRGGAGVGKTYLVSSVAKKLLNVNVTYVYGKFKHSNNSIMSPMEEIFTQLIEQILTLSEEQLNAVKKMLRSELGNDINLIIAICPYAEKVLGYYRKINEEDYHKLEYRFQNAIHIFLNIMSQKLYPVILHIDDLQWADESFLRIINSKYIEKKIKNATI
jgi:predicted ATPase